MGDIGDRVAKALAKYKAAAGITTDFFVGDIPAKKLANARQSCGVPDGEVIRALVDCTVFGSAKKALLFGDAAIYFSSAVGTGRIEYGELPGLNIGIAGIRQLHIGDVHSVDASGCQVPPDKLVELVRRVQETLGETTQPAVPRDPVPVAPLGPPADSAAAVVSGLERYKSHPDITAKLFLDSIPAKKLDNARRACELPEPERVLALFDLTTMGSAKNCLLFGTDALHVHDGSTHARVGYDDLVERAIETRGGKVTLGEIAFGAGAAVGAMLRAVQRALRGDPDRILFHCSEVHVQVNNWPHRAAIVVTGDQVMIFNCGPIDMAFTTAVRTSRFGTRIDDLARAQDLDGLLALDDPRLDCPRDTVGVPVRTAPKKVKLRLADEDVELELDSPASASALMAVLGG